MHFLLFGIGLYFLPAIIAACPAHAQLYRHSALEPLSRLDLIGWAVALLMSIFSAPLLRLLSPRMVSLGRQASGLEASELCEPRGGCAVWGRASQRRPRPDSIFPMSWLTLTGRRRLATFAGAALLLCSSSGCPLLRRRTRASFHPAEQAHIDEVLQSVRPRPPHRPGSAFARCQAAGVGRGSERGRRDSRRRFPWANWRRASA